MPNDNTITQKQIDEIFDKADKETWAVFNKTFVLAIRLPNGFVIVESSSCVDPANFDIEIGREIVTDRIKNKLWELEGYRLQNELNK